MFHFLQADTVFLNEKSRSTAGHDTLRNRNRIAGDRLATHLLASRSPVMWLFNAK
ncbi:MAG: hypothetical protein OES21_08710 [Myxococcales bacterium]|jgi:hypothetical protein|nr:hypothetical protein [Myxococcales bacterium]